MSNIRPIPAFNDNYIWLITDKDNQQGFVVDPGDPSKVEEALAELGITLKGILITHHHFDHVGGVTALVDKHKVPVYGPKGEQIPNITHPLVEGDEISLDDIDAKFKVFDVPGHTAGHIAYYCEQAETPFLFCGDTLFSGGCGRLFEGTAAQMHASLAKFTSLPANTLVYCTHEYTQSNLTFALAVEPSNEDLQAYSEEVNEKRTQDIPTVPSTIGRELAINPFLRCDQSTVISSAESHSKSALGDPVAVFKTIREWKDNF